MSPLLACRLAEISNLENGTKDEQMAALVDAISSYVEHYHNGSVKMVARKGDTIKVVLGGACVGCPITPATLCGWVLGTVQQFFPQIQHIEPVE
jgi:Fe-S cluster biogenesis protein NfuA